MIVWIWCWDDCMDLVLEMRPAVETEEFQILNNKIYRDLGAVV